VSRIQTMRFVTLSLLTVLLAGCGGSASLPPANGGAQPPRQPAPQAGRLKPPPPAWVESSRGSRWLGYSSFCWGTTCADFIAPRCGDERHTPTLRLRSGERIRFHLAFTPTELGLTFFGPNHQVRQHRLPLSRTPSWHIARAGTFSLFARAKGGDASYVACVRLN
jgi:hypothetical protein